MCNCIKDTENKLNELIKENNKFENVDRLKVSYPCVGLIYDEEEKRYISKPYLEFIAKGEYTTKSGNQKTKKESLNVTFTYCPFCGEKI